MPLMTQAEWAERHGFSKQYANELVRDGKIPLHDGLVNAEEADEILITLQDPGRPRRRKSQQVNGADTSLPNGSAHDLLSLHQKAKIKKDLEQARILRLKADLEEGKLVRKEDVEAEAYEVGNQIREALLNLPTRLAPRLVGLTDEQEIEKLLIEEVTDALEALSDKLT